MPVVLDTSVDSSSPELNRMVRHVASDEDAARRLLPRVLLHIPRLAGVDGHIPMRDVEAEIARLAREESRRPEWMQRPVSPPRRPGNLCLVELASDRARVVHERHHYLRSYRQGRHVAGVADGRVAVLLTLSPLDLGSIREAFPVHQAAEGIVLSRVFATGWSPRNSLSNLLARITLLLREETSGPRVLLTYLNPNVGFDGASYKAANWSLVGREHGTRYAYLDREYVTDRALTARFGTSDAATLAERLPGRIEFSSMRLRPLELYAYPLDRRMRRELLALGPQDLERPWA